LVGKRPQTSLSSSTAWCQKKICPEGMGLKLRAIVSFSEPLIERRRKPIQTTRHATKLWHSTAQSAFYNCASSRTHLKWVR
jgi:hypothetical protein